MCCEKIQKLLPLYRDGLNQEQAEFVKTHLEKCEQCRKELEFLNEISAITASLAPHIEIPEQFNAELHEKLLEAAEKMKKHSKKRRFNTYKFARYSGIAACLAVAILVAGSYNVWKFDDGSLIDKNTAKPIITDSTKETETPMPAKDNAGGSEADPKEASGNKHNSQQSGKVSQRNDEAKSELSTPQTTVEADINKENSAVDTAKPTEVPEAQQTEDKMAAPWIASTQNAELAPTETPESGYPLYATDHSEAARGLTAYTAKQQNMIKYIISINEVSEQTEAHIKSLSTSVMGRKYFVSVTKLSDLKAYFSDNKVKYSESIRDFNDEYKALIDKYNELYENDMKKAEDIMIKIKEIEQDTEYADIIIAP